MAGGRPLLFKTVEELQVKIDAFLGYIKETGRPMTLERLAIYLECDTVTIANYWEKEEFFQTVKQIRDIIYAEKVERLNDRETFCAGQVFDLKNNGRHFTNKPYSWRDNPVDDTKEDKPNVNTDTAPIEDVIADIDNRLG